MQSREKMARKSNSKFFSSLLKLFRPGYYVRKPQRLAFLAVFLLVLLYVGIDRQNSINEREHLARKLQELESDRKNLETELRKVHEAGSDGYNSQNTKSDDNSGEGELKQLPIILGVDSNSNSAGNGGSHQAQTNRKLMPEDVVKPLQVEREGRGRNGAFRVSHGGVFGAWGSKKKDSKTPDEAKNEQRREAIKWGMIHAWGAYEQYAWGYDELQPQSKRGVNHFGGLGATIVDSLDTLYIMGLKDQFEKAKTWVLENMDFNKPYDCSVFETTIRVVGGLLSAYDLSGDPALLAKAKELADKLLPAFNTPTGIPFNYLNLQSGHTFNAGWSGGSSILADIGTLTLEFVGLSQRTGDPKYKQKAENVVTQIKKIFPADGLVPIYISPDSGQATSSKVSFGAMGDSFFEYLLKAWIQGGKTKPVQHYRDMWETSMIGFRKLVKKSTTGLTYIAERMYDNPVHKMDHLACFVGGMLVLGAEGEHREEYLELAKGITKTCYEFYARMPSKLSGEHYLFNEQGSNGPDFRVGHAYNIGRPETVESLMYMWRATKDPIYREWGWDIWQAFEKQCRLPSGYTGLQDVSVDPPAKDDMMQSFFLAETLKYLYLLFSPDDVIPLDTWVFNTEAHPIKIISRADEDKSAEESAGSLEQDEPKEVFNDT